MKTSMPLDDLHLELYRTLLCIGWEFHFGQRVCDQMWDYWGTLWKFNQNMTIIHWEFECEHIKNLVGTLWGHKNSKPPPPPKPIFVYTNTPSMMNEGTYLLVLLISICCGFFFLFSMMNEGTYLLVLLINICCGFFFFFFFFF